jgi:exodeoxyribonuclease VII large subunit
MVGETLAMNSNLFDINVSGEISNLVYHQSGHVYFSLKDAKSSVKINFWRSNVEKMSYRLEDGMEVQVRGNISVYTPNGTYALNISQVKQIGTGAIQKLFEKNLQILKQQNLLNRELELPKYPQKIAIATSKTGAALQDMLSIYKQTYPIVELDIYNIAVQGPNISVSTISALEKIYQNADQYDLIIIARGGGSIEDLWGFNDINIAYKISESPLPVISAIGHEINFVLTDFIADYRAPTPTAAASMSVPNKNTVIQNGQILKNKIVNAHGQKIQINLRKLHNYKNVLINQSPILKLNRQTENFQRLKNKLINDFMNKLNSNKNMLNLIRNDAIANYQFLINNQININNKVYEQTKSSYEQILKNKITDLDMKKIIISSDYNSRLANQILKIELLKQTLKQNNMQQKLKDGYAIIQSNGELINSVSQVGINDKLKVTLYDGVLDVQVIGEPNED